MKVIKKGREQKGWAKEFICTGKGGGCGATLLVEEDDFVQYIAADLTSLNTFTCCECGVQTDILILDSEIPAQVRANIRANCGRPD